MKTSDAAARAEAARRAQEAARRAAEAKRQAQEAAKKQAQADAQRALAKKPNLAESRRTLATQAGSKPTASSVRQAFGKDEASTGLGGALRRRSSTALGIGLPSPSAPTFSAQTFRASALGGPPRFVVPDRLEAKAGMGVQTGASCPATPEAASAETNALTRQAKTDAASVQGAYDKELAATGGNEAKASKAAAQEMNRLIETHPNDPAYANSLIRESSATLDKITSTAAKNASGQAYYKDGDDDAAIKQTMTLLSDIAESAGTLGTYQIAESLAEKLPNRDELEAVDDGFYDAIDDGHSDALFRATYQRMLAKDKGEGAEELVNRSSGFSLNPLDHLGDLAGAVGDLAGDAIGVVGDVGSAVIGAAEDGLHVITEAGEFVVDAAKGTVNLAKGVLNSTFDEIKGAVAYAVEQGLELAGDVRDFLRDKAMDVAGAAVGPIGDLEEGESVELSADLDVSLGVSVGVNGSVSVTNTGNGYVVAGQVGADFGLAAGGEGEVGLSGRVEMTFDSPEEAKEAAKNLLLMGTSGVSPVLMPVLAPSPSTLNDMMQHVTAVEISGSAAAEIDGLPGDGLEGQAGVSTSYRMEFEDGKPVALVRKTSLDASLSAGLPKEITDAFSAAGLNVAVGANFEGSVELETRIPLSGDLGGKDLLAFIASPVTATVAGEAETSLTLSGSVDGSSTGGLSAGPVAIGTTTTKGTAVSLTISDIDASEIGSVFNHVVHGDFGDLFEDVGVNISGSWETYTDVETGIETDFTIGGQGVEASAGRKRRDIEDQREFDVHVGADETPAPAPRPGGSGGTTRYS